MTNTDTSEMTMQQRVERLKSEFIAEADRIAYTPAHPAEQVDRRIMLLGNALEILMTILSEEPKP